MPNDHLEPPNRRIVVLRRVTGAALAALTVAVIVFYSLWSIADSAAINSAEEAGFDRTRLLPNWELMWIAAHASVAMVLVVDVLAISWLRAVRGAEAPTPVERIKVTRR